MAFELQIKKGRRKPGREGRTPWALRGSGLGPAARISEPPPEPPEWRPVQRRPPSGMLTHLPKQYFKHVAFSVLWKHCLCYGISLLWSWEGFPLSLARDFFFFLFSLTFEVWNLSVHQAGGKKHIFVNPNWDKLMASWSKPKSTGITSNLFTRNSSLLAKLEAICLGFCLSTLRSAQVCGSPSIPSE